VPVVSAHFRSLYKCNQKSTAIQLENASAEHVCMHPQNDKQVKNIMPLVAHRAMKKAFKQNPAVAKTKSNNVTFVTSH